MCDAIFNRLMQRSKTRFLYDIVSISIQRYITKPQKLLWNIAIHNLRRVLSIQFFLTMLLSYWIGGRFHDILYYVTVLMKLGKQNEKKNCPTSELIKDEFYSWQFTNSYSINSYIDLNLHFFFKFNISFMNQSEHRVSVY